MKAMVILLTLLGTSTAAARQYIQCGTGNNWDRAVINLNEDKSTLFMTNGVHLPPGDQIRVLKNLYFENQSETRAYYKTKGSQVEDTVAIPLEVIGQYASDFEVVISHKKLDDGYEYERRMYCFSSIYED